MCEDCPRCPRSQKSVLNSISHHDPRAPDAELRKTPQDRQLLSGMEYHREVRPLRIAQMNTLGYMASSSPESLDSPPNARDKN